MAISTYISIQINIEWEYRDGVKIKRDKIRMPCTHSTVICNSQPKRIDNTSPILSPRQLVNPGKLFNIPVASKTSSSASSSNS